MTDSRPRPQYGEYATPQEQAKAMGVEYVPTPPPTAAPPAGSSSVVAAPPAPAPLSAPAQHPPANDATAVTERPQRTWNLMVTVALLVFGGISVLQSFAGYVDLGATINTAAERMGAGEFTSSASTRPLGIAIAISSVVIYLISLAISVGLLRARRIAFWVPLAGATLWLLITIVLMAFAITSDPTFMNNFMTR